MLWNRDEFVEKLDHLMLNAHQMVNLTLARVITDLNEAKEGWKPNQLAWMLISQAPTPYSVNSYGGILDLFFTIYHTVQYCTKEEPYFTLETKQYKWRQLYNEVCHHLGELGLFSKLECPTEVANANAEDIAIFHNGLNEFRERAQPHVAPSH